MQKNDGQGQQMTQSIEQIIAEIVAQKGLSRNEVHTRIEELARSLKYGEITAEDPTIAKLLAQELQVDLEDSTDYLYVELIYDHDPLFVRLIPFTTADKGKIKQLLRQLVLDQYYYFERKKTPVDESIPEQFSYNTLMSARDDSQTYVRNGLLFHYKFYTYTNKIFSLDEVVDQAELFRTFTDYQTVLIDDKAFIPYSLVDKVFIHPPEWIVKGYEYSTYFFFPYITLDSLQMTPDLKNLVLYDTQVREVIGTEALQFCSHLRQFTIVDEVASYPYFDLRLDFPPDLSLPRLETFFLSHIGGGLLKKLDLSFLRNCQNLQEISVGIVGGRVNPKTGEITKGELILPTFNNHPNLKNIKISRNSINSVVLNTFNCPNLQSLDLSKNDMKFLDLAHLQYCSNLQTLDLSENDIQFLDLTPLQYCSNLQTLNLRMNHFKSIDLTPLQHCSRLQYLNLYQIMPYLKTIDLTPLQSCSHLHKLSFAVSSFQGLDLSPLTSCFALQELFLKSCQSSMIDLSSLHDFPSLQVLGLSNNHLDELDLSPLANHPTLKTIYLSKNNFASIDLSPLIGTCPNLQTIDLQQNPISKEFFLDNPAYDIFRPQSGDELSDYRDVFYFTGHFQIIVSDSYQDPFS